MSDPELPTVGLDPTWLVEHLSIDGAQPIAAELAGFIGTGQMSRNARIALEWSDDDGTRPRSVVIKVPSADAATRVGAYQGGAYGKECLFYDTIVERVDITTPRPFLVHTDDATNDFVIVLEDMAGSEQGDQFTEPTTEQLATAVDQAAALHAPVWGRVDDPVFTTLGSVVNERIERYAMVLPLFHATVLERLGDQLDADVIALLERFVAAPDDWLRASLEAMTLVHGDFRPDNFLIAVADDAPPLAVVDWQTLTLGLGPTDVAYLLGGALTPERRHAEEASMIELYREHLARRGVELSGERCAEEYAIGAMHGVVIALAATTMAERTERGDALFVLMLNRHGRHAIEQETLDRLADRPGG